MSALSDLKRHLRPGQVYRRKDLARWSNAVDRHVRQLVDEGRLDKVSAGVYMAPRQTRFGVVPAWPEPSRIMAPRAERLLAPVLERA